MARDLTPTTSSTAAFCRFHVCAPPQLYLLIQRAAFEWVRTQCAASMAGACQCVEARSLKRLM